MKIIKVKDIKYAYDESGNAVDGVSFEIEKGSYTTIVGHNGSGKSTIAKLLAGLLPLKEGSIMIDDVILSEKSIDDVRYKLGIVFQNPDNQFIGSTVRDDIAFGLENHQIESSKMDDIINKYSAIVNMSDYLEKEPNHLSGGQKQRVAIAGVLAMGPEIIIFDEATSMLDPRGKDEIKRVIYDLHNDKQLTIISITHDIEEALKSDHVIVMNKGKVYMDDKPVEIFKHEKELRAIGLDIPFTYKVADECIKQGLKISKHDSLEGLVDEICQLTSKN